MQPIQFTPARTTGPLAADTYVCSVAKVEVGRSPHGHEVWRVEFVVRQGRFAGRILRYDLPFARRIRRRARAFRRYLGVGEGRVPKLTPDQLIGRTCLLNVWIHPYEGRRIWVEPE